MNDRTEVVETPPTKAAPDHSPLAVSPTGQHETAITAAAAHARAAVEARYVMALHRPRDMDNVRSALLRECRRPRFAAVARYSRPAGREKNERGQWIEKTIEGPSVRLAEAAIRCMGNVDQQTHTVYDDADKRVLRVECTDLESNTTYSKEITVSKQVERRSLRKGQKPSGTRTNSYGDTVYIVQASEIELTQKQDAEISKVMRTLALRLVPGDIVDEAQELCIATLAKEDAKDPDAARKSIADAFASLGIMPADLKRHIGVELSACSPTQIQQLRELYRAIRDGFTTWQEVTGAAQADARGDGGGSGGESKLDALREAVARRAADAKSGGAPEAGDDEAKPEPDAKLQAEREAARKRGDDIASSASKGPAQTELPGSKK